ncbi:UDP-glycosyltransferase UGT4-like [Daktulosphaira vitifoliae]|uniref:UDP-glycosyltransferase UGT4-like n=1 Tax=Daktulosphaira vitifoliae TaxID=58002 RepID=UPI0021AAEAC5|nr:UDP-glycosyltransferase UGT4-like [Daktulosphaira vitifoliae]
MFVNVFHKLKQKVLWKWNTETPFNLSKNVMISDWFPQTDILGHPNVKLFITHGGLHSFEEASFNAKPLIGIPFFGDQLMNIRIVEEKGFGKMIDIFSVNEETLLSSINEVIENPKYKENSIRQSLLYKDQDMKPIERALYWVNYILRHNDTSHLKSLIIGLNLFEYFLIDVTIVFCICMVTIAFFFFELLNFFFKFKCKVKST